MHDRIVEQVYYLAAFYPGTSIGEFMSMPLDDLEMAARTAAKIANERKIATPRGRR